MNIKSVVLETNEGDELTISLAEAEQLQAMLDRISGMASPRWSSMVRRVAGQFNTNMGDADHAVTAVVNNPGKKIATINEIRKKTGWGLKEANDVTNYILSELT